MKKTQKEHFWREPVSTDRWAKRATLWAGSVFVALGLLCCTAALGALSRSAPERVTPDSIAAVLLLAPGASLILFKSRVAAAILLGLSTLSAGSSVVLMLVVILGNQLEHLGFLTLVALFWFLLVGLTWWALRCAVALHRGQDHAPTAVAATRPV